MKICFVAIGVGIILVALGLNIAFLPEKHGTQVTVTQLDWRKWTNTTRIFVNFTVPLPFELNYSANIHADATLKSTNVFGYPFSLTYSKSQIGSRIWANLTVPSGTHVLLSCVYYYKIGDSGCYEYVMSKDFSLEEISYGYGLVATETDPK